MNGAQFVSVLRSQSIVFPSGCTIEIVVPFAPVACKVGVGGRRHRRRRRVQERARHRAMLARNLAQIEAEREERRAMVRDDLRNGVPMAETYRKFMRHLGHEP